MNTSITGINLIKKFEGYKLTAYQDQRGIWTIGVGHTGPDVHEGDTITEWTVDTLLQKDLRSAEMAVASRVYVDMTQPMFDALVSLVFNIGQGNFATSTMRKLINAGKFGEAAGQFIVWCRTAKRINAGLVTRRRAERDLFVSGLDVNQTQVAEAQPDDPPSIEGDADVVEQEVT